VSLLAQEMTMSPDPLLGFAKNLLQDLLDQGAFLGIRT
jgi:hypothetical protein